MTLQVVTTNGTDQGLVGDVDPQTLLHSDTFHPTAKAWLFLHDVGPEDGPFLYVPGSHKMTEQRYACEKQISQNSKTIENRYSARGSLRIAEADLKDLGYEGATAMVVRANTLVVADTHGFHARATSKHPTTRMEIYASLRRTRFCRSRSRRCPGSMLLPFRRSHAA